MAATGRKPGQTGVGQKTTSAIKTCKTCASCRLKKVRCSGNQPKCTKCIVDELECVYPQDARKEPRPSRARVRRLETTVATMLDRMKAAGLAPMDTSTEEWISSAVAGSGESLSPRGQAEHQLERPRSHDDEANSTPGITNTATATMPQQGVLIVSPPLPSRHVDSSTETTIDKCAMDYPDPGPTTSVDNNNGTSQHLTPSSTSTDIMAASQTQPLAEAAESDLNDRSREGKDRLSGLSPGEAHVAGVSHEHGCFSSVHGLASPMNNPSGRHKDITAVAGMWQEDDARTAASKARLISYAALQSQREAWVYNQPQITIDLDGCDVDLAKHLIELHFSMQHYVYLISYRPAIMDSLASGGGPWVNKLLLNAIYYSSSLYSNRPCLQQDPSDHQSIGSRFYARFCQLLGGEIAQPSIPSAVALLLMSASLVSHGRPSAGWNLSGLAYRMVIDLGCHLTPGLDCQAQAVMHSSARSALSQDLEQEMRKKLYWGAFATDATQSLYLGRPCMLAPVEARVPLCFLDTFEELAKWEPYVDAQTPQYCPPPYAPQPAHAVSTFGAVARLLQISTRITKMYGIDAIKGHAQDMQRELTDIEHNLQHWSASLPSHLRFDPEGPFIPPPHKITPQYVDHSRAPSPYP